MFDIFDFQTVDPFLFEFLACLPRPVLMVEDDPSCAHIMKACLRAAPGGDQFDIHNVKSVKDAKRCLKKRPYSLVISDYSLEGSENGMDLWAFCEKEFPDIPFLVTSSFSSEVARNLSTRLGSAKINFLEKPFSVSDYTMTVSRLLRLE